MISTQTIMRRLAAILVQLAFLILPASGKEWAQAMLAEFYSIEREDHALTWAVGCVIAAIKMRGEAMLIGNLKVSRRVLGLELILCFNPLTFAWLESLFWLSMTNLVTFQYSIRNAVQPVPFVVLNISTLILGTLGPLSLIVGFRSIFLRDHFPGKFTQRILFAGPLALGIIHAACWSLLRVGFDYRSAIFLVSILPALSAAHMIYICPSDNKRPALSG